jgi:hypothetical protein
MLGSNPGLLRLTLRRISAPAVEIVVVQNISHLSSVGGGDIFTILRILPATGGCKKSGIVKIAVCVQNFVLKIYKDMLPPVLCSKRWNLAASGCDRKIIIYFCIKPESCGSVRGTRCIKFLLSGRDAAQAYSSLPQTSLFTLETRWNLVGQQVRGCRMKQFFQPLQRQNYRSSDPWLTPVELGIPSSHPGEAIVFCLT